jgi:hypothetical protein
MKACPGLSVPCCGVRSVETLFCHPTGFFVFLYETKDLEWRQAQVPKVNRVMKYWEPVNVICTLLGSG